jgi:type IV fimbrial biogenesis protein FimT
MAMSGHTRVRVGIDVQGMALRTAIADDPTHPLRVYEWGNKSITIESMSNGSQMNFYPSGRSATANTIVLRDRQYNKRVITISITGKVTLS